MGSSFVDVWDLAPKPQENNNYIDYFSNYMNNFQPRERDYYFNMEDPEVQKYQQLAARPPASQGFIEEYLGRRPDLSDYQPSTGRKLLSFLGGTLAGFGNPNSAYQFAQRVRMDPYNSAYSDWQGEGANIVARAKAMDEAQKNELLAHKFGLEQKAKAAVQERLGRERQQRLGQDFSKGVTGADLQSLGLALRNTIENNRQAQIDWMNQFRTDQADRLNDYRADILDLRERGLEKQGQPRALNPAQQIQQDNDITAQALREAGSIPVFASIIEQLRAAAEAGGDPVAAIDYVKADPKVLGYFKNWLKYRRQNLGGR